MATEKKSPLPLGLVLSLGTAILYAYSYSFEIGYSMYFGYPSGLISIGIGIIMNLGVGLFLYTFFFVGFFQLALQYWPNTKKHIFRLVIVFILFFSALIAVKGWLPKFVKFSYMLVTLTIYLGLFALRIWEKRDSPSDLDKIPMAYDARSEISKDSIAYAIVHRLGFDPLLFGILLVIVLPILFWSAGYVDARSRTQHYLFVESGSEYVVLRFSGSRVIGARLGDERSSYYPEYIVRTVTDVGAIQPMNSETLSRKKRGEAAG